VCLQPQLSIFSPFRIATAPAKIPMLILFLPAGRRRPHDGASGFTKCRQSAGPASSHLDVHTAILCRRLTVSPSSCMNVSPSSRSLFSRARYNVGTKVCRLEEYPAADF
jgi:hypothetical protein